MRPNGFTMTATAIVGLLLALVCGMVAAEMSWPAGDCPGASQATYPNQGHRLIRQGDNLHLIYDMNSFYTNPQRFCITYTRSTDLGNQWASIESVEMSHMYPSTDIDWGGALAVDHQGRPWVVGFQSIAGNVYVSGTVRQGRADWTQGVLWPEWPNPSDITVYSASAVLSPQDGEPMMYALIAYDLWDVGGWSSSNLDLIAWDISAGVSRAWYQGTVAQVTTFQQSLAGSIAVSRDGPNDILHVAYQLSDGVSKVYYIQNANQVNPTLLRAAGGVDWDDPIEVSTPTTRPATQPAIEYDAAYDSVFVAWRGPGFSADVFRRGKRVGGIWLEDPMNVSQPAGANANSESPTMSTRFGVSWQEYVTQANDDIYAWLDGHVVCIKSTGHDSTSRYPHIAVVPNDWVYVLDCYTIWTERCVGSRSPDDHEVWFKKYRYIPMAERPGGESRGVVRLADGEALLRAQPSVSKGPIRFELIVPKDGACWLSIQDRLGSVVRTLSAALPAPGCHVLSWDGLDQRGRPVPTGVYFCRLTAPDARAATTVGSSRIRVGNLRG